MPDCFCSCGADLSGKDAPIAESVLQPEPFPAVAELALAERELKRALKEGTSGRPA